MYTRILSFLVIFIISLASAESATQTDWSGGPGMWGPVMTWGTDFHIDTDVVWDSSNGLLELEKMICHTIDEEFWYPTCLRCSDVDGDGDLDVIGAAYWDAEIAWWENLDGTGILWSKHYIDHDYQRASSVTGEDVDGDGDMDVMGSRGDYGVGAVSWWENLDGFGTSWLHHLIDGSFGGASSVYGPDVNGDGFVDLVAAAKWDGYISWWENYDGSGVAWVYHEIASVFRPESAFPADIDGDGLIDVVGTGNYGIWWWRNSDGSGTSWIEYFIDGMEAEYIHSDDIDGDGDMDVIGCSEEPDGDVIWWENQDGVGTSWIEHVIVDDFLRPYALWSEDLDGDGDTDIVGGASSYASHSLVWWENLDGVGGSWSEHAVFTQPDGSSPSVYADDINADGDIDIIGGAGFTGDCSVYWWDLTGHVPCGSLESSLLDTQCGPTWGMIDWNASTPPLSSLGFQVRSSDTTNYLSMGEWSDTLWIPCSLEGILTEGEQYVQYRAILDTSNPDSTPTLNDITITWDPLVSIEETADPKPSGTELLPIAPNPVAGSPIIRFGLPENAFVNISVFDLSGRIVSEIQGDDYSSGYHDVLLGGDMSPGIYFCRMISGGFIATQRFVVIDQ